MSKLICRYAAHVFASIVIASGVAACAHDTDRGPGVATTTGAIVTNDHAVTQVAVSRCRRAAECNRIGTGRIYTSKDDCMDQETVAARQVAASCTRGVDSARFDTCIDMLENEHCDANLGAVTNMPNCGSYCAR